MENGVIALGIKLQNRISLIPLSVVRERAPSDSLWSMMLCTLLRRIYGGTKLQNRLSLLPLSVVRERAPSESLWSMMLCTLFRRI